jgi:hypothetical protein
MPPTNASASASAGNMYSFPRPPSPNNNASYSSTAPSNSRLYMAPQATIRDALVPPTMTNRRRRPSGTGVSRFDTKDRVRGLEEQQQDDQQHQQQPNRRFTNNINQRTVHGLDQSSSSAIGGEASSRPRTLGHNPSMSGSSSLAFMGDDSAHQLNNSSNSNMNHHYYTSSKRVKGGSQKLKQQQQQQQLHWMVDTMYRHSNRCFSSLSPIHVIQFLVLLALGFMMYDSHHKVQHHRNKLVQYDEERSHILEQMHWMDTTSKKIHANVQQQQLAAAAAAQQKDTTADASTNSGGVQQQFERVQLRLQSNARDELARWFGDKPITMTVPINKSGNQQQQQQMSIHLALSNDVPHAIATLLEQERRGFWKLVTYTAASANNSNDGFVTITSDSTGPLSPRLVWLESSRSCHERGSVMLQQQKDDALALLIRVRPAAAGALPENVVCIGQVESGLEHVDAVYAAAQEN